MVVRGSAWSCEVGRARSCAVVRGRACVVGHALLVMRGRAWSCVVVRGRSCVVVRGRAQSCVRGRSFMVVRGRSCMVVRGRSCVVVPFCPLRGAARFAASTAVTRTNERTTSNNPLNPPGVGWVKLFYPIKVRVSMGTCVPNLGAIPRPVRKFCLSNL